MSEHYQVDPIHIALGAVETELRAAMEKFGPMASAHEGYAVIQEELDELWDEVKAGNRPNARAEAIQVAAMAVRFLIDVGGRG